MELFVRLVRALWVFGIIFASYMTQLFLVRLLRTIGDDPETGEERVFVPEELVRRREWVDAVNAKRLLAAILRLRGVYIKLGQVLSTRPDLLPRPMIEELRQLQDKLPPFPFSAVRDVIQSELGCRLEDAFAELDETPVAAASVGYLLLALWLAGYVLRCENFVLVTFWSAQ